LLAIVGNAILCFIFAYNLSYTVALFVWLGLAVTALFGVFPSHVKIVRLLGDDDEQGSIFGLTEAAGGIGSIIVNAIAVFLFARAASEVGGFKLVVIGYGVASLIVGFILYFLIENPVDMDVASYEENSIKISDFLVVLKNRGTWHTGFSIFAIYTLYVSLSYFTPYSTSVLGVTAASAGVISIARTYVIRIIGSPLGGVVGDKLGSVSKAIIIAAIGGIASIVAIMVLPAGINMYIVIALTLLLSIFTYMGRANMFAVQSEVKIPPKYAATAAGITCGIGYFPDLFQFTLFGNWLDNHGNAGYNYIFIYTIVILALGVVNSILAIRYKNSIGVEVS
jgi:MFS family permease